MLDFIKENPPDFQISTICYDHCKKQPAQRVRKSYYVIIIGERRDEDGVRSVPKKDDTSLCFTETRYDKYRLRLLCYVTDKDKKEQIYTNFANDLENFIIDEAPDDIVFCTIGMDLGGNKSAHAMIFTGFSLKLKTVVALDEYYYKRIIVPAISVQTCC